MMSVIDSTQNGSFWGVEMSEMAMLRQSPGFPVLRGV
jgi:hypothetical protein